MEYVSARLLFSSIVASCVVLASGDASAAEGGCEETISGAEWLAGRWVGNGLGGEMEETWANNSLRMRVKHFTAEFVGWEAADSWHSFESKQGATNPLTFDGLNITRLDQSRIEIAKALKREGQVVEEKLTFQRAPL